jgi:protein CpxP
MSLLSRMKPLIFVATLVCAYPLIALADPATPPGPGSAGDPPPHERGMGGCAMMMHEGGHDGMFGGGRWDGHDGMAGGGPMFGEGGPMPPFLRGLHLSEAQQDKVFTIMHAQAPQAREQAKTLRKAHRAMHELATSAKYDDAKAKALSDALAKAISDMALLHARTAHQVYEVLTPEQREAFERHARHHAGGGREDGAEHERWHHEQPSPVAPQQ